MSLLYLVNYSGIKYHNAAPAAPYHTLLVTPDSMMTASTTVTITLDNYVITAAATAYQRVIMPNQTMHTSCTTDSPLMKIPMTALCGKTEWRQPSHTDQFQQT